MRYHHQQQQQRQANNSPAAQAAHAMDISREACHLFEKMVEGHGPRGEFRVIGFEVVLLCVDNLIGISVAHWHRGIVEAADCLMARWHRDERLRGAGYATQLRTPRAATRGAGGGSRTDTAVDECRNERIDRVTRYLFD